MNNDVENKTDILNSQANTIQEYKTILNDNNETLKNNDQELNKIKEYCLSIENENKDLKFKIESRNQDIDKDAILNNQEIMQQIITKSS